MKTYKADIVIYGAGIAGLWTFNRLKTMGYDVLLLERTAIGGGQTIASQGIIHSGLKYAFAGKINALAKSISAMPDLWRAALNGEGAVDLSKARVTAQTQYLLIPSGLMGGLVRLVTQKLLGDSVRECAKDKWPQEIKDSGFKGSVIYMDEPVLDIPSVLRALAEPYKSSIRKGDESIEIEAKCVIHTSAASNHEIAKARAQDTGLSTQKRPLLMGMMRHAPYPLYAHMVGNSDKPVATITTHKMSDGTLVWYLGGGVAERDKEADPREVYAAAIKGFSQYMPDLDLSNVQWATLPIDRVEGKSETQGWMPDTPTIHRAGHRLYCWPTKLTFAPMLCDMIIEHLENQNITPSGETSDWSALPECPYTQTPWDDATWTTIKTKTQN